jgi:putative transposase
VPQTLTDLTYHVVFATRKREPLIADAFRDRLYGYMGSIVRADIGRAIAIGGTHDHVHVLVRLPPTMAVSAAVKRIKGISSKWLGEQPEVKAGFRWQRGFSAFTVSHSAVPRVRAYIEKQAEHHRALSSLREIEVLLLRHGLTPDPRDLSD